VFGVKGWVVLGFVFLGLPNVPGTPPAAKAAAPEPSPIPACAWFLPLNDNTDNALYLDQHVNYWATRIAYAPGESLTIRGQYPHARYFSITAYDPKTRAVSSLYDAQIAPEKGSSNPYLPGADRTLTQRDYTVSVVFNTAQHPPPAKQNELRTGYDPSNPTSSGTDFFLVYRVYVADKGTGPAGGEPLPAVTVHLKSHDSVTLGPCAPGDQPPSDVNNAIANANSPAPIPIAPGADPPYWHRFYNVGTSLAEIVGASGAEPYTEKTGTGGLLEDLENAYLFAVLNASFGPLFVVEAQGFSYPPTQDGQPVMAGGTDMRYWSFCSYDTYTQRNYACLADYDADPNLTGHHLIVVSDAAHKPANLCGASWLPFGPLNESLLIYRNQLAVSPLSIQAVDPAADNAPQVMGGYYPGGRFLTEPDFTAQYC
jgi:hypothetical protein